MKNVKLSVKNTSSDYPNMHDKIIRSVFIIDNNTSMLCFGKSSEEEFCLVMSGIDRLRANNFRQGNIVLDVDISTIDRRYSREIAELYDIDVDNSAIIEEKIQKLINKDKIIVVVNPSYGCELSCVCTSAEFSAGPLIDCIKELFK